MEVYELISQAHLYDKWNNEITRNCIYELFDYAGEMVVKLEEQLTGKVIKGMKLEKFKEYEIATKKYTDIWKYA